MACFNESGISGIAINYAITHLVIFLLLPMIDTGRKYSRCNTILCARYKNICIRIWLTDKNPVKIVQKKYITAVIL